MTRSSRGARAFGGRYLVGAGFLLFSAFLITGLATYSGGGGFSEGPLAFRFSDSTGILGHGAARLCLASLGWVGGWLFPALAITWGLNRVRRRRWASGVITSTLCLSLALALASLSAYFWSRPAGGGAGLWVAEGARSLLGPVGSMIFLGGLAVLSVGFVAEREINALIKALNQGARATGESLTKAGEWARSRTDELKEEFHTEAGGYAAGGYAAGPEVGEATDPKRPRKTPPPPEAPLSDDQPRGRKRPPSDDATTPTEPRIISTAAVPVRRLADPQLPLPVVAPPKEPLADLIRGDESEEPALHVEDHEEIELPTVDLLDQPSHLHPPVLESELLESSRILVQTLADFGVTGRVGEVHPGPVITSFEYEPAAGVRIAQILNRADDLALALKAMRIRIVAPIPGKAAVGVEIPNRNPATVFLREIVESPEFTRLGPSGLNVALGKDIGGKPICADLTKMPHLLIAGTTGSGKSVCVNAIISSLLLTRSPRDLRLLMIDPKMLELPVYNGIPHLLQPVVTDPKQAARTLRGLIAEMERRYTLLARRSVRNIDAYHERLADDRREGLEVIGEHLPYVVAIIDELADLMMTSASEVEEPIGRLAQMARAVGIHLIVATQRPSVDVITGVIKANFPSRIAFQVATRIDSRTILDGNGAESLLGRGDMLFMFAGRPEPERVHGAFVSDRETERLVKFWRRVRPKLPSIDLEAEERNEGGSSLGDDPLFEDAARLVVLHQQGSASLLQRRLKVGYSRAARLVDMLEEAGIVAPSEGSKAREVLVNDLQLDEILKIRSGQTQPS